MNPPGGTVVPTFPPNKGLEYKSEVEPFAADGAGLENKLDEESFATDGGFAGVEAAGDGAGLGNRPGEEAIADNSGFAGVAAAGAATGALRTGVSSLAGVAALDVKVADVPPLAGFALCC